MSPKITPSMIVPPFRYDLIIDSPFDIAVIDMKSTSCSSFDTLSIKYRLESN
jgi:hypothetical protein